MKTILSFAVLGAVAAANAQIINGDFESGNIGFTSEYTYVSGYNSMYPEATINVGTNPNAVHDLFASMGDHTSGQGNMLVVNGAPQSGKKFWSQDVALLANTTYDLSFWAASVHPAAPATIKLSVNDVMGSGSASLDSSTMWMNHSLMFTTGAAGIYNLGLIDTDTTYHGNDFAVDDIKVAAVPEPTTMAALGFGALGLLKRRKKA